MKFILSDVNVGDGERISRYIEVPAMRNGPLHQLMFPPASSLSLEQNEEIIRWYTNMLEVAFVDRWESFLKATDADGTPYGFCGWTVIEKKKTTEATTSVEPEIQQGTQQAKRNNWIPEALNTETWVTVSQALRKERNRVLKDLDNICRQYPMFALLEALVWLQPIGITFMAVKPDYQRQGIGSSMMERMCKEIDAHGRYAYVLASPEGALLYSKFGFVEVGQVETDKGVISSMLRQPRQAQVGS